jgi:hypothetical protein
MEFVWRFQIWFAKFPHTVRGFLYQVSDSVLYWLHYTFAGLLLSRISRDANSLFTPEFVADLSETMNPCRIIFPTHTRPYAKK